jgi:putative membrane protein insertion efficiency factor
MKQGLLWLIEVYRKWFSPFLGNHCRFTPNCSSYAQQVIDKKGVAKGSLASIARLLKCHPFNSGGYDPVE